MTNTAALSTHATAAMAATVAPQVLPSIDAAAVFPADQFVVADAIHADKPGTGAFNLDPQILKRGMGFRGWLRNLLRPEIIPVNFSADPVATYFHGTSMPVIAQIMNSGGMLSTGITFVATADHYSQKYARSSARRKGGPGIVMAFEALALRGALEATAYQPGMVGDFGRTVPSGIHNISVPSSYFQVKRDLPLSAQTDISKMAVLRWLTAQRDAHEIQDEWNRWIDAWKHFSELDT